ncbi:DUF2164 family protein [Candidatus Woesebacteria bacterium]|nr:DUF2164 family protein [Candidatus Woesebacteria bacterium]
MKNDKSNLLLISDEKKRGAVEAIIAFYKRERDEEIGVIAAEEILEFVIDLVGKDIFNKGIDETVRLVQDRLSGVWMDVEAIVKKG